MLKLTLVVEIQVLLSSRRSPLLEHSVRLSLPVQLSQKAHKDSDHTVVIPVIHGCLCANTHRAGESVSTVIMFCLLLAAIADSID